MSKESKYNISESEKYKILLNDFEEFKGQSYDRERLLKHQKMLTDIKMQQLQGKVRFILFLEQLKQAMIEHKPNTLEQELIYKLQKANNDIKVVENVIISRDKIILQLRDTIGEVTYILEIDLFFNISHYLYQSFRPRITVTS